MQPHVPHLSRVLGYQVVAEPWGTRWARLAIDLKSAPWTAEQAKTYADLLARFIAETFLLLRQAFVATPSRRRRKRVDYEGDNQAAHPILDQQINQIQEYLRGRAVRPSDEVLCEWVYFCYTFELFSEGARLFDLIDSKRVAPWPYDRAKRVAKICRMRAKSS